MTVGNTLKSPAKEGDFLSENIKGSGTTGAHQAPWCMTTMSERVKDNCEIETLSALQEFME